MTTSHSDMRAALAKVAADVERLCEQSRALVGDVTRYRKMLLDARELLMCWEGSDGEDRDWLDRFDADPILVEMRLTPLTRKEERTCEQL